MDRLREWMAFVGAAVGLAWTLPVAAQDSVAGDPALEVVIVTGTRIQRANLVSISPITQLDAESLRLSGVTRLEDLLKELPQLYSLQNSAASNDSTGTATLDLRNLGSQRTLVLVDGRRLPQGSPFTEGAADINQIPGALVKQIEVLTGGASAVYGSDAMAGVINFLLVDDFEGVNLDYQFSQYSHDNGDGRMGRLLDEADFTVPSGTERDGDTHDVSFMIGGNMEDGRGNITAYATYRDIDAVVTGSRDNSACKLGRWEEGYFCEGSSTIGEGRFSDFGVLGGSGFDLMVQGHEFVPYDGRAFNWGATNYFQRPDERWTAGALGHYAINERVQVYSQFMYTDDRTESQIAPSGTFFVPQLAGIGCGNPLLSQQQFDTVCGAYGLGPEDRQFAFIGRRNVESGPRRHDIRHTSFRGVFGLRGNLDDNWRYDVYGQYAEVDMQATYHNDMLVSHMQRALDVVADPDSGEPVCRSVLNGSDLTCVPWNIFEEGAVTQAALDYVAAAMFDTGSTDQTVVSGYIAGDLADYGWVSPFAETGVEIVFGAEYREENLERTPDKNAQNGEYIGFGGAAPALSGGFDVQEYYAELSIPLVEARPLAESLALELGYRYSDYSPGDSTDTWKLGGSWLPVEGLRFRGSYQRAVRSPNVGDLFWPTETGGWYPDPDPCAGSDPARSLADCARTGVTAEQYGNIPVLGSDGVARPADGLNIRWGGNTELEPEKSDTYSLGFLYSPSFLQGLSLSLDWYEIEIDDTIASPSSVTVFEDCLDTGAAWACRLVQREEAFGTLWLTDDAYIDVRSQNLSYLRTSGYDLIVEYALDLETWGNLQLHSITTWLDEWEVQQHPGGSKASCAGLYNPPCGVMPELRNHLRVTWATPWDVTASVLWRYVDEVEPTDDFYEELDSANYFDVALLWEPSAQVGLRVGVNNLFDEEPPIAVGGFAPGENGNTRPGLYDALGQYWFAGVSFGF